MKRTLFTLSALALAANLLVPERLISYQPCCYDNEGKLSWCKSPERHKQASLGDNCCRPIEQKLRAAPPSDMTRCAEAQKARYSSDVLGVASSVVPPISSSTDFARPMACETGPPRVPDVLTLHCRLNI